MLTRRYSRGFTLVEMLAVVAMVGILAALAVVGYRKYLNAARGSEVPAIFGGMRAGEEAYRAETLSYLGCSGCGGTPCAPGAGTLATYFPQTSAPGKDKWAWMNPGHADAACWRMLNVHADGTVIFGFSVVAGNPGQAMPGMPALKSPPTWPAAANVVEPWYVMQAVADRDGNSVNAVYAASSLTQEYYVENDTE